MRWGTVWSGMVWLGVSVMEWQVVAAWRMAQQVSQGKAGRVSDRRCVVCYGKSVMVRHGWFGEVRQGGSVEVGHGLASSGQAQRVGSWQPKANR